jgi:hypothetical protein
MSVLSTVITLGDYLVILLPLMAWVAVLGFIWRCSNADDPRASFRNWRPAILLVACIAALLSFLAWRKTVREELGHKTRIVRVETRALESAALMYYYEESEAWLVGGNREVIEKLTKLRENGSPDLHALRYEAEARTGRVGDRPVGPALSFGSHGGKGNEGLVGGTGRRAGYQGRPAAGS